MAILIACKTTRSSLDTQFNNLGTVDYSSVDRNLLKFDQSISRFAWLFIANVNIFDLFVYTFQDFF